MSVPSSARALAKTTVDVVIVTYNAASFIGRCLESVQEQATSGIEVRCVVVDNASPDETAALIRDQFPAVRLVARTSNDGFAKANNAVLGQLDADVVLILNPDTVLAPRTLERLLPRLCADPAVGMVGCRLELVDGSFDHACKRSLPTPRSAARYMLSQLGAPLQSDYLAPGVPADGVGDVGAVNGAFMLARTDALRRVGSFDERYWMYAEDLDLCRRFADAGYRIVYDGTVASTHLKGASAGKHRPLRLNWHFHFSMIQYFAKFEARRHPIQFAAVTVAVALQFLRSALSSAVARRLTARRSA